MREQRAPYDFNRVVLPKDKFVGNGKNLAGDKETIRRLSVVVNYKGRMREAVSLHWYMGRSNSASLVYASVWVHGPNGEEYAGHGSAGGHGYHKESAAAYYATTSAGLAWYSSFAGCGDSTIRVALEALINKLYRHSTPRLFLDA